MKKKRPIPQYDDPYTRKNHFLNTGFEMGFGNVQEIPYMGTIPDPTTQINPNLERPIDPEDFHTLFESSVQDLVSMAHPLDEPWQDRLITDVSSIMEKHRSSDPGDFANLENVTLPYNPWASGGIGQINLRQAKAALYYSTIPQIFYAASYQYRKNKADFLESFQLASTRVMEMINNWNTKWGSFSAATTRGAFFGITEGLRADRQQRGPKGTMGGITTAVDSVESAQSLATKLDRLDSDYDYSYTQTQSGYSPSQFIPTSDYPDERPNTFWVKTTWEDIKDGIFKASTLTGQDKGRPSAIPLDKKNRGSGYFSIKKFDPVAVSGRYVTTQSGYKLASPGGRRLFDRPRSDEKQYIELPKYIGGDDPDNINALGQPTFEDKNYFDILTEKVLRWSGRGERPPENLVMDEPNFAAFPDTNNPLEYGNVIKKGLEYLYNIENPQAQYGLWMAENFAEKGAKKGKMNTVLRFGPWRTPGKREYSWPRPDQVFQDFLGYMSYRGKFDKPRNSILVDYAYKRGKNLSESGSFSEMHRYFGKLGSMWSNNYDIARKSVEGIEKSTAFEEFQHNVSMKGTPRQQTPAGNKPYSLLHIGSYPNKSDINSYWLNQNQPDIGYEPEIPPEYYAQDADLMAYDWQQREQGLRTPASQMFSPGYIRSIAKAPVDDVPGHEDIAIKVNTGKGETYIQDKTFTGPDWAEITPLTYAKATKLATKTGGHISGSYHSQPTGRSGKPSKQDEEGLGWLGDMEIQEEGYRQTKASAPTRLWRGEFDPFYDWGDTKPVENYVKDMPEYQDRAEAFGRWFAPSIEEASWYMWESNVVRRGGVEGIGGVLSYLDVDDPEKYLVANSKDPKVKRFSLKHNDEYFVTREMAARRNVLSREESLKLFVQPKSIKRPLERNIGEMKASAPPKGYFSLDFEPTVVPSYFSTWDDPDTNKRYYRAWGDDYNADRDMVHTKARIAMTPLSGVHLNEKNESIFKDDDYLDTNSEFIPLWQREFRKYHFRGGEENISQFLEWRSRLSDQERTEFDKYYMKGYGEYLSLKSIGRGGDSAWIAASNAYSDRYNMPPYYKQEGSYSMLKEGTQWPNIPYSPPAPPPRSPHVVYPPRAPSTPPPASPPPVSSAPASPPPAPPAGGGTPPPPDDPFDFPMSEMPEDPDYNTDNETPQQPEQTWEAVGRFPLTESQRRAGEAMRRGESVLVAMPPGSGKTEFAKIATVAARQHDPNRGITIMMTPSTELNRSMAERLRNESGIEAYHLEGMPPYGQNKEAYYRKRKEVKNAIAQKTYVHQVGPDQYERRWKPGVAGITLVMSPESAQNIFKTKLGSDLNELTGMVIMDEGQEATKPGRPAMYQLRDIREQAGNAPTLIMGGTMSESTIEMFQRTQDISPENTFKEPLGLGHIDFNLHVAPDARSQNEMAAQLSNVDEGYSLTYAATTRDVEDIYLRKIASGRNTALTHQGEGGDLIGRLTQEQKDFVSNQVKRGVIDQDIVSSSVLGLGIDIRGMFDSEGRLRPEGGLSTVVNTGPAFLSDIIQRAARLRPVRSDPNQTVGKFHLVANPRQYEQWASSTVRDASRLAANPQDLAAAYEYARRQEGYSLDYKVKADQITQHLGDYLGSLEGGRKYSGLLGSTASSILFEAGLNKIVPGMIDDEMEMLTNFVDPMEYAPEGTTAEQYVTNAVTRTRYRDFSDHSRSNDFGQHVRNIGEYKSRELSAAATFFKRIQHLQDPQMAGRILRRGLEVGNAGGVQAFENYTAVGVNKDLANEYVKAVEGAIQTLREQESIGADMNAATEAYTKTINDAKNIIAGVPLQNTIGALESRITGLEVTNPEMASGLRQRAESLITGARLGTLTEAGQPMGEFSQDDEGLGGRLYRSPYARGFYALMMGRRAWQYTGASVFQDMLYGAEDFTAPLMTDAPMKGLVGGYQSRLGLAREGSAEATYQNFGVFTELGYGLSGNERLSRLGSAINVGGSIFSAGAMTGAELMFQGEFMKKDPMGKFMRGAGELIMGASIYGGAAIVGTSAVTEALNFGGVGQDLAVALTSRRTAIYNKLTGSQEVADTTPRDLTLGDAVRSFVSLVIGGPASLSGIEVSDRFADWMKGPQRSKQELEVQDFSRRMAEVVGGASTDYLKSATSLTQALPGDFGSNRNIIEDLLSKSRRSGMDVDSLASSLISTGGQYGYKPGDIGYYQILGQYQDALASEDPFRAISQIEANASRNYQFASQFSQYMPVSQAAQLTSRYQLTEPGAARSGIGALEAAMAGGINIDDVVATKLEEMYLLKSSGEQQTRTGEFARSTMDSTGFYSQYKVPGIEQRNTPVYETETVYQPKDITVAERLIEIQSGAREQFGNMAGQASYDFASSLTSMFSGLYGFNAEQYTSVLSGFTSYFGAQGFTPNQMSLAQQIMGGNLGAMSYASYSSQGQQVLNAFGMSNEAARFYDESGRPVYKTSGTDFFNLGAAHGIYKKTPGMSYEDMAKEMFGEGNVTDPGLLKAFFEQGTIGAQWNVSDQLYGIQQQSFALQQQQIDATRSYYGDTWALQDRMRQLQYSSQMRQFGYQQERMELTHQFAQEQDVLTEQRMDVGKEYQQWQNQFQQQGMYLQREWTRKDWQYQDTMRGLSYSWNMEDLDEAIRRSSGYERRQLIKQRERSSMTHGLEGEQIDEQRKRQEELWKREQDAFDKKVEYQNTLMELDEEQFEMNKSHREQLYEMEKEELQNRIKDYKQQFALQTQIEKRSREYQMQQLDFQEQALALQEQQAELQHQLEIATRDTAQEWDTLAGAMSEAAKYGNLTKIFKGMGEMATVMAVIPNNKLNLFKGVFTAMSGLDNKTLKSFMELIQGLL